MKKGSALLISSLLVALVLLPALPVSAEQPILVDKSHPLRPFNYEPASLSTPAVLLATGLAPSETELDPSAASALTNLFQAAQAADLSLALSSGYRSYTSQVALYKQATNNGTLSQELVAPPGYSEHQTGLAADVITTDYFCAAQDCFAMTRAAAWLNHNAPQYGFIIRYPLYETASTGYAYEPWHLRYVGVALAKQLRTSQQTLEQWYGLP